MSDCIFEIHQLWQSGFSWVYSNCYCSSSFKPEIIKIGQSSHKMYRKNIVNFQESTTILNACTKKSLETYWRHHVIWETRRIDCSLHCDDSVESSFWYNGVYNPVWEGWDCFYSWKIPLWRQWGGICRELHNNQTLEKIMWITALKPTERFVWKKHLIRFLRSLSD